MSTSSSDAILTAQHVPNTTVLWVVDDKNGSTIWTAPEADDKKEERQVVVEGSSSSARPQSMPEADAVQNEGKAVPVGVAIKLEDDNQATLETENREAIIGASAQAIDPRHPVISGFFVQVSTTPCPRCRFEVIDGMLSCGQCSYTIVGKKTSHRDSVIRQRRAEFLSKIAVERGMRVDDEKLLESYGGKDFSTRGTASPVAELIRRAKDRRDNANRAGYRNVMMQQAEVSRM